MVGKLQLTIYNFGRADRLECFEVYFLDTSANCDQRHAAFLRLNIKKTQLIIFFFKFMQIFKHLIYIVHNVFFIAS